MGFGESVVHWIQRLDYGVFLPAMAIDPDNLMVPLEPIHPFLEYWIFIIHYAGLPWTCFLDSRISNDSILCAN